MTATPLSGKRAIVCAGSKGLGKATAMALARQGAAVVVCSRGSDVLHAAAREIAENTGATVVPITADVSVAEDVERLVREGVAALGGLDILVTNTGGPRSAPFEAIRDDEWQTAIDSLLLSVVRLCRAAIPHMRKSGGGRIVNITSVSVKQPIDGLVLSNALRAAVTGLARTLANELASDRITVNCVAPGFTATDRLLELNAATAAREGISVEAAHRRVEERIPMRRMGTPEEFASAVAFLASDHASYVTGVTLQVDGGFVRGLF